MSSSSCIVDTLPSAAPNESCLDPHSVAAREYIEAHKSIPSVGRTEAAVRQEMTKVREDVVEQLRIGLGDAPLPA